MQPNSPRGLCCTDNRSDRNVSVCIRRTAMGRTLVMTTISSRGSSSFLIAFPSIISDRPLEYICTLGERENAFRVRCDTHIGGIEGLNAVVVSSRLDIGLGNDRVQCGRQGTDANLICLIASSSSSNHSPQPLCPYCIVPRMSLDTLRPELPKRTVA